MDDLSMVVTRSVDVPPGAEISVQEGQYVERGASIASYQRPEAPRMVDLATMLGVRPAQAPAFLSVSLGQELIKYDVIAQRKGFMGRVRYARSPVSGRFSTLIEASGHAVIVPEPTSAEISAPESGLVRIISSRRIQIQDRRRVAARGALAIGGSVRGFLAIAGSEPIGQEHEGQILVLPGRASVVALREAWEHGVSGIIAGGMTVADMQTGLHVTLNEALHGKEPESVGLPSILLTEGCGPFSIHRTAMQALASLVGQVVTMTGYLPDQPPAVLAESLGGSTEHPAEWRAGQTVRLLEAERLGEMGRVVDADMRMRRLSSGVRWRSSRVTADDGSELVVAEPNALPVTLAQS